MQTQLRVGAWIEQRERKREHAHLFQHRLYQAILAHGTTTTTVIFKRQFFPSLSLTPLYPLSTVSEIRQFCGSVGGRAGQGGAYEEKEGS
jgi:hypothetical protein